MRSAVVSFYHGPSKQSRITVQLDERETPLDWANAIGHAVERYLVDGVPPNNEGKLNLQQQILYCLAGGSKTSLDLLILTGAVSNRMIITSVNHLMAAGKVQRLRDGQNTFRYQLKPETPR